MSDFVTPSGIDLAAAVCFRRNGPDFEILLVRTSSGKRWIFPKGKRKSGESTMETAARETDEEAGVTGRTSLLPITTYESSRRGVMTPVAVHLLEIAGGDTRSHEAGRTPTWMSPAEARERLSTNRSRAQAEPLQHALDIALAAIRDSDIPLSSAHR